jgi:hypothetical protein
MTDRCWDGVVSPRGCPRKGVGRRVTSALRLELTYRSSQAMRIPAILLFYIYIFFFISESGFCVGTKLTGVGSGHCFPLTVARSPAM